MAEPAGKIYSLIPTIMKEVGAIAKNGVNEDDGYMFRAVDDVLDRLQPLLSKHGVFFSPSVIDSKEERIGAGKRKNQIRIKLTVLYKFFAGDGSSFEARVEGEAIDDSDKATNKAMTAAFKQMAIQVFCIAVKGADDPDKLTPPLTFVPEKKTLTPKTQKKNKPISGADMKIPDGKFRGRMLSAVPTDELTKYIEDIVAAMKTSGRKPPKWFEQLRRVSGI